MTKTNVCRLLDAARIPYETAAYDWDENDLSGVHAAAALHFPPERVFKTLLARGDKTGPAVFCIPVAEELDLKKAAAVSGNKKVELCLVKELLPLTGYLRGGCSPIGMKKKYPAWVDETALLWEKISISAGQRGHQVLLDPAALLAYTGARTADLIIAP